MRQAGRLKMYPPRELVQAAVGELATELEKPPAESAFSLSSGNGGKAAQSPEEASLIRAGREALVSRVIPSLRQLHRFLAEEYLPACAVSPSLMAWPNGSRMYGLLLRRSTTTTMTAAEIHRLGLSEVARIQAEMKSTVEKTGFRGTLDQFFAMIRSDERFYCKTPDELLTAYRATAKRIEPAIVKLFRTFPRMPFGVEASRAISGPAATYAGPAIDGSRAGIIRVSTANPAIRPIFEIAALMLHEGVPGHHLQRVLEQERYAGATGTGAKATQQLRKSDAFTEGWALYAESLGTELGVYVDAYEEYGRLSYEMLRAVRLVIDTGIHSAGWTREEAKRYFIAQTGKQDSIAESEVKRAIWDPGSLVHYKVGELKFRALRTRAEQALGDRFDIRDFHDFLLGFGAIPLDILEQRHEQWLGTQVAKQQKPN